MNSVINIAATNSVEYNDTVLDMQGELVNIGVKPIIVNKAINFVTKYDGSISKGFGNMGNSNMTIYYCWNCCKSWQAPIFKEAIAGIKTPK